MATFIERLATEILVCDGAMGTTLHATGVSLGRSLPELNLIDAGLVRTIHESFIASGAQMIQSNTFGASRERLKAHGLEDRTDEINRAGVRIAREAVAASGRPVLLAGSVGPVATGALRARTTPSARLAALQEQISALLEGGLDLIIFETFVDLAEMLEAVTVAKALADIPIVAQMTFVDDGRTMTGDSPAEVGFALEKAGVDVVGLNCSLGPQGLLRVLRQLSRHTGLPLSAQPNAGQARMIGAGRFGYQLDEEYFAQQALRYVEVGACVIGGCCGTTPQHIEAVARELVGLTPSRPDAPASTEILARPEAVATKASGTVGLDGRLAEGRSVLAVEIGPVAGGDAEWVVNAAEAILSRGIDLIAIAPSSSARAQMSPISAALLLQQRLPVETIVSMTTWDKSIMALQADLLGAHSCGIRTIICRTGTPPLQGDYPNLDGIWDVDSIGLLRLVRSLNQGHDHNGVPIRMPTAFSMGARVNTGARDIEREIARARLKVAAGAQFLITEPAYDLLGVRLLVEGMAGSAPVLLGLQPLRDHAHAEYLHHEVPDVSIPSSVLERMRLAGQHGPEVGLAICRELAFDARDLVRGLFIALDDPATDLSDILPRPGPLIDRPQPSTISLS